MTWGLESASVRFGTRTALNRVTLRAEPSTVSVVVGGDGAGKSTLLRALVGLVPLCSGLVRRPSKKEIGYVPATAGLYVDLTVGENLAFAGGAYGVRGAELIKRSSDILERIGLSDARARLGGQLSGGMQRKLAVGMALLHRPALLALGGALATLAATKIPAPPAKYAQRGRPDFRACGRMARPDKEGREMGGARSGTSATFSAAASAIPSLATRAAGNGIATGEDPDDVRGLLSNSRLKPRSTFSPGAPGAAPAPAAGCSGGPIPGAGSGASGLEDDSEGSGTSGAR